MIPEPPQATPVSKSGGVSKGRATATATPTAPSGVQGSVIATGLPTTGTLGADVSSGVRDSVTETPATSAKAEPIRKTIAEGGAQAKRAATAVRHSAMPRSGRLGGDVAVEIIPPPWERGTAASASGVRDSASAAAASTPVATITPKAAPAASSGVQFSAIGEVGSPLTLPPRLLLQPLPRRLRQPHQVEFNTLRVVWLVRR
jgi:hypothetical protein